jgi:hypothetical protein
MVVTRRYDNMALFVGKTIHYRGSWMTWQLMICHPLRSCILYNENSVFTISGPRTNIIPQCREINSATIVITDAPLLFLVFGTWRSSGTCSSHVHSRCWERLGSEVRSAFSDRRFYYVKAKNGFQEQSMKNLEKQWINSISEDYG